MSFDDEDQTVVGDHPSLSELFSRGIRRVRIEQGPDGQKRYLTEPLPPEAGPEISTNPHPYRLYGMMMTPEQVRAAFDESEYTVPQIEEKPVDEKDQRIADLREWWLNKAIEDVEMVAEKAVTYGSNSLEQLGRKMAQLNGRKNITAEEAQELGCWVYLTGKAERWTDAVMRGERPKDDTILDIAMYATMAARIRVAGGWPDNQQ